MTRPAGRIAGRTGALLILLLAWEAASRLGWVNPFYVPAPTAVVGEFVASSRGLGYLLQFAQSTYNAALTLALIVIIMGFALLLFAAAERLERRLLRWKG